MAQSKTVTRDNNRGETSSAEPRVKRTPVFQQKGKLRVEGEDPNFVYRWVYDKDDRGSKILKFIEGGYQFVTKSEAQKMAIGDNYVFDSEYSGGSIIRRPAGENQAGYLYYMKIPKDWYLEDQALKEKEIYGREQQIEHVGHDGSDNEGGYDPKSVAREIDVSSRGR